METWSSQVPNDSFYVSAPTSPGRCSQEHLCFYSGPTSPTIKALKAGVFDHVTPTTYEDAKSNFDEFEFDTSHRFNLDECQVEMGWKSEQHKRKKSPPAMAFADELFCDGKVMPLKLPPRLQYVNSGKFDRQSSTRSSQRSPTSVLRLPFQRRTPFNDDFDPFMIALEKVRGAGEGESPGSLVHRRARSMSPIRVKSPQGRESPIKRAMKSPPKLTEPKGVQFTRRARLVKADQESPGKPSPTNPNRERETRSKKQRIKRFLFRGSSTVKREMEKKQKQDPNSTETKAKFTWKSSFKSIGITQRKEDKVASETTKLTLTHYRPKLLLCVGLGAKYVHQ